MFRPHLDVLTNICEIPDGYENLGRHKTYCCNVVSDFYRKSVALSSRNFCWQPRIGRPVDKIGNFEKNIFNKLLARQLKYILIALARGSLRKFSI